ncbi:MAG TPA: hypothetical protein VEP89_01415 [Draconibacterium sp.]|nr:hypothetical protein [Draconibacterium sp.]
MKTLMKYIIISLFSIALFTACDGLNEPEMLGQEDAFVAFTSTSGVVSEINSTINIPVKVSALAGAPAITVTFDFDTEGIDNPAIEGEDFVILNASKTLSVNDGFGYDTIKIQTIDNDVFTGQKNVNVKLVSNSLDYDFGAENVLALGISDDDHPFGWMLGDYSATGNLWRAGGRPTWDMTLNPVDGDIYSVEIIGMFSVGGYAHPATSEFAFAGKIVENEDGTYQFQFLIGQEIPGWAVGGCTLVGWRGPDGAVDMENGEPVIGDVVVGEDGSVKIEFHDEYGILITEQGHANEGILLEAVIGDGTAVNTVWTRN